jgi:hypothetical protein
MLDEDQDVRDALRTELAERTPPTVHGGLAEVVSRGRRRRRTRQLGSALAVVAALGGTTAAAVTLGSPNAMPPAGATVTAVPSTDAAWPRADLPTPTPYGTWAPGASAAPPAGRAVPVVPRCSAPDTSGRSLDSEPAGMELQQRVTDAVPAVAGGVTVGVLVELYQNPNRADTGDAYTYTADLTDANGTGSMVFSVGRFRGTPLAAADDHAFDESNCAPPKRHVLSDGTVLQIYPVSPSEPFQSLTQSMRIYRPNGTLYTLAVRNWGSPDLAPNPAQPANPSRVGAGRATLPLSEAQLADLGLAVVGP